MDKSAILNALGQRSPRWGICKRSAYVNGFAGCLGDGFCPTQLLSVSKDAWADCLKEADAALAFADPSLLVKSVSESDIPDGGVLAFDCIITTTRKDRDGDILESSGAMLDTKMPLLWQHLSIQPIGKFIQETMRSRKSVGGRFAIADIPLGRDAATLVKFGALRISHGFEPVDFEPMYNADEEIEGWRIRKFHVMEVSAVSIPSNIDSEILVSVSKSKSFARELDGIRTAYGQNRLETDAMKSWAKRVYDNRPAQGRGAQLTLPVEQHACTCGKTPSSAKDGAQVPAKAHCLTARSEPDPLRWNRKLSKSFDVALEYLQPTKLEYDWVSRYLNCEIKNIFQNSTIVPTARMGSWLTGLRHVTANSTVDDIRNIEGDKERPPEYEVIQLNSKQSDDFLIDGISFHKEGRTKYVINVSPCYAGLYVILYTSVEDKSENRAIIDKTWQWAIENNFLKGEAFSLSGEFLPRTETDWCDVFLPEKNEKPLKRMVDLLNSKGKSTPNRGMILMGPPGTGKTLSGRIIKNQADATFIWISSRDFYYSGAFGGFAYGFELARELAPAVLFVEDVDNWLTERTLDLLKTEMDGIGRSSGVVTILTTNFPERLPEALIDRPGRFHDVLKFDLPTAAERKRMLAKWIASITDRELMDAVSKTDGYSGAHLYELANFAKSIQEEDQQITLAVALQKAIEKIAEQRELITESQLAGSNYRPRKQSAAHWRKVANGSDGSSMDMDEEASEEGNMGAKIASLTGAKPLTSEAMDDGLHHHFIANDPQSAAEKAAEYFGDDAEVSNEAGIWSVEVEKDGQEHMLHFLPPQMKSTDMTCPECGHSGPAGEFMDMDSKGADIEVRCFAALMKDANRMRAYRDRLTTVLDAQSQREWATSVLDDLLAVVN